MAVIRRFGIMSVAKFTAGTYFFLGLLYSLFGLVILAFSPAMGLAIIIGAPIAMGAMGFVMGGLLAVIANFVLSKTGGIAVETEGQVKKLEKKHRLK